ncbi:tetratricopeptide repeat protein [Pontibacter korlensis]|uniref:tetratricopeptide repeat-containing sensor histidine kinase n=1 Tax=Pontibacter korlensis TaxID=400092 RepID=UPI000698E3CC|nr:tetratricopeptide repeat protein [Pontibacter korlensis]
MKTSAFLLALGFLLAVTPLLAQSTAADSLNTLLEQHQQADTVRAKLLNDLAYELRGTDPEKSYKLAQQALRLAGELNYKPVEATALRRIGSHHYQKANYEAALRAFEQAQQVARQIGDSTTVAWAFNGKGTIYHSQSDYPQALQYYLQAVQVFESVDKHKEAASIMGNVGVLYKEMGELKSALTYFQRGLKLQEQLNDKNEIARFLNNIGGIYSDQRQYNHAESAYRRALDIAREKSNKQLEALVLRNLVEVKGNQKKYAQALSYGTQSVKLYQSLGEREGVADTYYQLSSVHLNAGHADSALYYASRALALAQEIGFKRNIHNTYHVLAEAYAAKKNFPQAYEAQQKYIAYKDSLVGEDKKSMVAALKFQYELDKKQSQITVLTKDKQLQAERASSQRQQKYALLAVLVLVALIAGILVWNNRKQKKTNDLLRKQKAEIDEQAQRLQQLIAELNKSNEELQVQKQTITKQRDHLEQALAELKSAQEQLVQREKMASLGEVTAGIAHEIQNPLNFVNNFSELSVELVQEIKEELQQEASPKNGKAVALNELLDELEQNLDRITQHGKRANCIVKDMLQHSGNSTGDKQPTDINALADEFLRLSYHGLRAKDKNFNAKLITDLDPALGKVKVVPQEIGRVLLNLFNNAFYATQQLKSQLNGQYQPEVRVSTRSLGEQVEIRVRDNGAGIPATVAGKIFQPFFTTKPTGQGTGLGLSLSYDIITKGHGGELKVETKEGEYTEFTICLPAPQ